MAALDHPSSLATRAIAAADPRERLRAVAALRSELDEIEADAVRAAIDCGSSWTQVARRSVSRSSPPTAATRSG